MLVFYNSYAKAMKDNVSPGIKRTLRHPHLDVPMCLNEGKRLQTCLYTLSHSLKQHDSLRFVDDSIKTDFFFSSLDLSTNDIKSSHSKSCKCFTHLVRFNRVFDSVKSLRSSFPRSSSQYQH